MRVSVLNTYKIVLKFLETFLTLKIGISRSNFISSRIEDFRVFYYVIWWTEYEKRLKKSLRYPWPWKSTVKVTFHFSLTLKMSIYRRNFSFQHKRSEPQPHIWRLHKILRHSYSAWSKINDVTRNFFFAISVWELVHLCCWCTENETNIITYRRNSSHLQKYLNVKKLIYC